MTRIRGSARSLTLAPSAVALGLLCLAGRADAIGCIGVGTGNNSSVGEQFKVNQPGRIRLSYLYSYSDTDHFYYHERRVHATERSARARSLLNEHLVLLEVDVTERLSLVLEAPFLYGRQTRSGPGSVAVNGAMIAAGVGDVRMLARYWLYQDEASPLRLYGAAGLRVPTGGSDEKFTSQAGRRVDKDVSVQPGTGNLAGIVELGGTFQVNEYLNLFFQGRYTFAPATHTSARNFRSQLSGVGERYNSDSDSANWRVACVISAGLILREAMQEEPLRVLDGLGLQLGIVGAHVPYDDLLGADGGFRRAANIFFVEPGLIWSPLDQVTLSVSVPVTVYRYVMKNGGNVPEYVVQFGATFTFG